MSDEIEKTVIIKIDLDVNDATKKSVEYNKQIDGIKKTQKELKDSGKELTVEYQQNKEKLTILNRELRENNKVIQDVTKANNAAEGSNEKLRAQLSILTSEYNKLSAEERENTTRGIEMGKQVASLTETLKKNESAVGDNRRNVGNYVGATKLLKAELKAVKDEMVGLAAQGKTNSEEFAKATKRAGELTDQLADVKDAVKATASGSEITILGKQIDEVRKSVLDLDFKEAAEKSKALGTSLKAVKFTDILSGAKSMVIALYEMAAAMFALPIVWIIAGIAAIAVAWHFASKSTQEGAQKQVDAIDGVINRYSRLFDIQARFQKAAGQTKDAEATEMKKMELVKKGVAFQIAVLEKLQGTYAGLNEDQEKQLEELRIKQLENIADIGEAKILSIKSQSAAQIKAFEEEQAKAKVIREKRTAENLKILEEQRRMNEERLADNLRLLQAMQDQKIDMIRDDESREQAKLALDHTRRIKEITDSKADASAKFDALLVEQQSFEQKSEDIRKKFAAERKADFDKQSLELLNKIKEDAAAMKLLNDDPTFAPALKKKLDLIIDTNKQIVKDAKEREQAIQRLEQASFSATSQAVASIAEIRANERESEIIGIENETKIKIDNLQAQADAGIITQDEFQTKSNRIKMDAAKAESVIKKKQFEESKKIALIQVAIKTAQGVMTAFNAATPYEIAAYVAIALATGALEAAVIQSQPTPAFADGGKAISGKRITASDGRGISRANGDNLLATVKTGEVILNEHQQALLGGDETFRRVGVPGFAGGGSTDGGVFANSVSGAIDQQVAANNNALSVLKSLPNPIVFVQDIAQKTSDVGTVEARATI